MTTYQHKEAYCLMWYACPCGHRERFWNSRDGVTPFGTFCPSCDQPSLHHVEWQRDERAPNHKPFHGQRVWVDMTRERAEQLAHKRIEQGRAAGLEVREGLFEALVEDFLRCGEAPDMKVWGYDAARDQEQAA